MGLRTFCESFLRAAVEAWRALARACCVIPGRRVVRWPHAPAWRRKYLPGRIETNDEFSPQKSPRFQTSPPPLASGPKPIFSRMGLWANRAEGS